MNNNETPKASLEEHIERAKSFRNIKDWTSAEHPEKFHSDPSWMPLMFPKSKKK